MRTETEIRERLEYARAECDRREKQRKVIGRGKALGEDATYEALSEGVRFWDHEVRMLTWALGAEPEETK